MAPSISDPPALTVSQLQALTTLCAELSGVGGLPTLTVRLAKGLAQLVAFDQLALVMHAPDGKRWALIRPRLSTADEPGWMELVDPEPALDQAMANGQASWRNGGGSYMLPPGLEASAPIRELAVFPSALCVPLRGEEAIIGAVGLFAAGTSYNLVDLHVLTAVTPLVEAVARELLLREEVARWRNAAAEVERFRGEVLALFQGDLRGPLVVIDNGLDFLGSALLPPTAVEARDHIEELRLVAATLVEMVDTQADFIGLDAGWTALSPMPIELDPWMKERVAAKAAAARLAEVQVFARCEPPEATGTFDSALMGRAVDNLLVNCIRHTPRKGQVAIVARVADGTLTLAIGDTGASVPAEQRETVFERPDVSTLDGKPPSRAYGLPFSKAVVEAHGGRITIESPPTGGNLFRLAFPM